MKKTDRVRVAAAVEPPFKELRQQIQSAFDSRSMRAGRLVQCPAFGYIHYAVALSDSFVISWGPEGGQAAHGLGVFTVGALTSDYMDSVSVPYRPRPDIRADLLASASAFHRQWDYCVRGWNCEHWGRLVVAGEPLSYQCRKSYFGLAVFTGGHFKNPDAEFCLSASRKWLKAHARKRRQAP